MKQFISFLAILLLLAFVSGVLFIQIDKQVNFVVDANRVDLAKQTLMRKKGEGFVLKDKDVLKYFRNFKTLEVKYILPRTFEFPLGQLRDLNELASSCVNKLKDVKNPTLKKLWQWYLFKCNLSSLPADYFKSKPLFTPYGESFAFMAFKEGGKQYQDINWVFSNLASFHVTELKKLQPEVISEIKKTELFKILMSLDIHSLSYFKAAKDFIVSPKYAFFRKELKRDGFHYNVYRTSSFKKYLLKHGIRVKPFRAGYSCLLRYGQYCFEKDTKGFFKQVNTTFIVLFLLVVVLIGLVIIFIMKNIRHAESDRARKDFILKTIAHEIRSPVTGMKLALENIKQEFDNLPPSAQEDVLHLSGNISRLKHVVEKSRQYLSGNHKNLLELNHAKISSVHSFIESIIDSFGENKEISIEVIEDFSFSSDPYWLGVALKNLIDNALKHGKAPIKVIATKAHGNIVIKVIDEGQIPETTSIFEEFNKGKSSNEGLGLGLYLTKNIMSSLEGEVSCASSPTTFTVTLRKIND